MSKARRDDEIEGPDKHERLEELLRQTLTLAGEIAEGKGRRQAGECIVLRKRSNSDLAGEERPDIGRGLLKRRNDLMVQESLVEPSTETLMPQQVTENPRNERLGGSRTPSQGLPQGSSAVSRSPRSHRASEPALKKPQKVEEKSEQHTSTANKTLLPKWHVKILPVTSAREPSNPTLSSPCLVEFEAVFPLKALAESNAASSLAYYSETSYITIGPAPIGPSPGSGRPRADEEIIQLSDEKLLQKFIDEWEYDAEASGVDESRL
ncbi:hypothetical protein diail_4332 [Diaporthe ilicicola]|nr:hypothetical protein diail_4332 [Diaporthe ilicicola]